MRGNGRHAGWLRNCFPALPLGIGMARSSVEKRRDTPRGRRALGLGCGATAAVLTVSLFAYLGWANALPPLEPDSWVVPNPNGYDVCLAAVQKLSASVGPNVADPWNSPTEAVRKEFGSASVVLDELRAAMRLPYRAPAEDPANLLDPNVTYFRGGQRMLIAEARLALSGKKPKAAVNSALDAIEFGCVMSSNGGMPMRYSGQAAISGGQDAARRCLPALTHEEARQSGMRLEKLISLNPDGREWMEIERRSSSRMFRYVFAERLTLADLTQGDWEQRISAVRVKGYIAVCPKPWLYGRIDAYFRSCEREMGKPFPARRFPPPPEDWLFPTADHRNVSLNLTESLNGLRMLRVELALQEFRQRFGRYPAGLAELETAISMAPQLDPFTGRPFGYRNVGNHYLLYSMGPDGVDDGGRRISGDFFAPGVKGDLPSAKRIVPK